MTTIMPTTSSPFGSESRTRILVALSLLGESYARELARLLEVRLGTVQGAIRGLERDGIIAARNAGRTRLVRIAPGYFAGKELQRYLARLAEADFPLRDRVEGLRRRPRRSGKPL